MFVTRRSLCQIDPRLFLATTPLVKPSPASDTLSSGNDSYVVDGAGPAVGEGTFSTATGGPFISSGHLPSYYPPPPTQYVFTNGIRHPLRAKAPHQGEVFYVRYILSVEQYLCFRVPFIPSSKSQPSLSAPSQHQQPFTSFEQQFQDMPSDLDVLYRWLNDSSFNGEWYELRTASQQDEFLRMTIRSRHSFPIIGCWNGEPFGFS